MGRMIPLDGDPMIIHPALPFSLMVAGTVATIAIITGLCGFRKKASPPSQLEEKSDVDIALTNTAETTLLPPQQQATLSTSTETGEKIEEVIKELPPPPGMRSASSNNFLTKSASKSVSSNFMKKSASNNFMSKSSSTRKLTTPLSMKHVRSISVSKIREKTTRPKPEDSVWTKQIILGEKCKLPSQDTIDDDDDDDDDGKVNTVSTYHPRTMTISTISLSRNNSLKNPETLPDQDKEKKVTKKEEDDSQC